MSGEYKGRTAELATSTNGSSYNDIGKLKDISYSQPLDTIDVTNFDSSGWRERLDGIKELSLSFSFLLDESDTGQDALFTANEGGSLVYFRLRPRGSTATYDEYIFQGYVTNLDMSADVEGAIEVSCDVESSGSLTHQAQT